MTKLEALQQLAEKVKAGELRWRYCFERAEFLPKYHLLYDAYNGSLDAALSLRNAVLPDVWFCVSGPHSEKGGRYSSGSKRFDAIVSGDGFKGEGKLSDQARALLLAIIRALIAKEQQNSGNG